MKRLQAKFHADNMSDSKVIGSKKVIKFTIGQNVL